MYNTRTPLAEQRLHFQWQQHLCIFQFCQLFDWITKKKKKEIRSVHPGTFCSALVSFMLLSRVDGNAIKLSSAFTFQTFMSVPVSELRSAVMAISQFCIIVRSAILPTPRPSSTSTPLCLCLSATHFACFQWRFNRVINTYTTFTGGGVWCDFYTDAVALSQRPFFSRFFFFFFFCKHMRQATVTC